jgi:predicted peroxiredoxin
MTCLSKNFMATDVSAMGQQVTLVFLSTGTMVVCLKHVGITDSDRERLEMSVKTLSVHGNLSGPVAL